MGVAGAYSVYAWITGDCFYRIVETASGTIVAQGQANSVTPVTGVRLATSGTNVLLTYLDAGENDLCARRIVCGTDPPTVGTETALVTDLNASGHYDICAMLTGW